MSTELVCYQKWFQTKEGIKRYM